MGAERRWAIVLVVLGIAMGIASTFLGAPGCDAPGPMLVGPGEDDGEATTCTQAMCLAGSAVCCPGRVHGAWDTIRLGCICPGAADADADTPDVPGCTPSSCNSACRSAGYPGGNCSGALCICGEWPADADADADADAHPGGDCRPTQAPELGGECNAVYQCGCGAGERCWLNGVEPDMIEECVPAGTDPPNTHCTSADNCVAGSQCFGFGAADITCMQFCYEDGDCWDGLRCLREIEDMPVYRLCDWPVDCDPFTAAGCAAGEACLIMPPTGETSCTTAGTLEPGEECSEAGQCRIGSGCYSTSGATTFYCRAYCDLAGTIFHCPPGETCQVALGHDSIGVCTTG